ncbi:MAG: hypothetical protein FJ139_05360 [Deltaproteobacteria bacterium]|nr:hypothetical protein [Deltaproteobacteria bacterium]
MSDRKMWKRWRKFVLLLIVTLLGACTHYLPPPDSISPGHEKGVLRETPSDADLFHEGMSHLGGSGNNADYEKARAAFDRLVRMHPESRWKHLTEVLIRVIDDVYACRGRSDTGMDRLLRENEQLKKNNRVLLEKLNSETAKLIQENDKLKKDIELLKSLEVQLEKRDKMLR